MLRLLALGSSSTAGFGVRRPEDAWIARLQSRLPPHTAVHNFGEGGATIGRFLARRLEIERIAPGIAVILPFTDYVRTPLPELHHGYGTLLDLLGALGALTFFGDLRIDPTLVQGVGRGPNGAYSPADRDLLGLKNRLVAELARARPRVIVVPVLDQNVAHPEWIAADGMHPNELGHAYLADTFWAAMAPVLTAASRDP
jgi:lysophospholipase L1-like esterase